MQARPRPAAPFPSPHRSRHQDYNVGEPIGRGRWSTVYKARRKSTIEYFAVKSLDKCARGRVLTEVQALRSLSHPGVLRFHAWFETSKHLWLILELCVGGDLRSLLREDGRVPELTLRPWLRDASSALRALHVAGVLHCDLKPSNVLLDEAGRLKLAGLGLARRMAAPEAQLVAAPDSVAGEGGGLARGSPAYMAPELLAAQPGPPSSASDLWSLGCLLYECLAGRPAFCATALSELVGTVLSQHPPALRVPCSLEMVDLLEGLLTKSPLERLTWEQLEQHPVWGEEAAPFECASKPLPPQHAHEVFLARLRREEADAGLDAAAQAAPVQTQAATAAASPLLPLPLSPQPAPPPLAGHVLQLSLNAKRNLLAGSAASAARAENSEDEEDTSSDGDAGRYSHSAAAAGGGEQTNSGSPGDVSRPASPSPGSGRGGGAMASPGPGVGEVMLSCADAELDFSSAPEVAQTLRFDAEAAPAGETEAEISEEPSLLRGSAVAPSPAAAPDTAATGTAASPSASPPTSPSLVPNALGARLSSAELFLQRRSRNAAAASGGGSGGTSPVSPRTAVTPSVGAPTAASAIVAGAVDSSLASTAASPPPPPPPAPLPPSLLGCLWHPSDAAVRPLVQNRRIEAWPESRFDAKSLPFKAPSRSELLSLPLEAQTAMLHTIARALAAHPAPAAQQATIGLLEALAGGGGLEGDAAQEGEAAQILLNGGPGRELARLLRAPRAAVTMRARAAQALAVLLRHTSSVSEELYLGEGGLAASLVRGCAEGNAAGRLRRRCAAALGELLYYAASGTEGPHQWAAPPGLAPALASVLRGDDDDVAQHYAARTLLNVATAGGPLARMLACSELASPLARLARSAPGEPLRASCADALARLCRAAPGQRLHTHLGRGAAEVAASLAAGLREPVGRCALAWASLTAQALLSDFDGVRVAQQPSLLAALIALRDRPKAAAGSSGGEALLRAKSCALLALALRQGGVTALAATAEDLCRCCERAASETVPVGSAGGGGTEAHGAASFAALCAAVEELAPSLLVMGGDAPRRASAFAQLLLSPPFAASSAQLLPPFLCTHLPLLCPGSGIAPELRASLHALLESLSSGGAAAVALTEGPQPAALLLLPALADAAGCSEAADSRFLALRAAADLLLLLLPKAFPSQHRALVAGQPPQPAAPFADSLLSLLREKLIPRAVGALRDADRAVPLYGLKLCAAALAAQPQLVEQAHALGASECAFEFLQLESSCNNVWNVRLCLLLAACPAVPSSQLALLDAAPRAAEVLLYAYSSGVQPFLEPALGVCRALLERDAHGGVEGGLGTREAFAGLVGALVALRGAEEAACAALAGECVALLEAAG